MGFVIKRLALGVLLIALASAVLLLSDLRQRQRGRATVPQIALVQHVSQPVIDEGVTGMLDGLAAHGFADGTTMTLRRYNAEGDMPTANTIAKQVTGSAPDLILTATTLSLQAVAAANRQSRIKHVFALVSDPYGAGVGISRDDHLDHPPWLAGFGTMQPVREAFELARRMYPGLRVVGAVWNPAESNSEANTHIARAACRDLGIELLEINAENSAAVGEAVRALIGRGIDALWVGGDVTVMTAIDAVVASARHAGIPVFTNLPGNANRGALFDLGANYHEVGRLAGVLAAEILKGKDPATVSIDNVVPPRTLINPAALAELKDPWTIPDDVKRTAEIAGRPAPPATATAAGLAPAAPPLAKTWNVNILEYVNVADVEEAEAGIREGLQESGLVEGRDYRVTVRNAQGDMPALSTLVDAALADGADLLMTLSTPTLQAALQRAKRVPVVFTFVADAIVAGAGRSNDDHVPNVTGVPSAGPYAELIDIVRECLPNVRRVGTLFVPAEVNTVHNLAVLEAAAKAHGIEVTTVAVNSSTDIADAALALCSHPLDAVVQVGGNLTTAAFASIYQAAQRARVPLFGSLTSDAHNGAAVVVARDFHEAGREAGLIAARIMRGADPATIPFAPLQKTRLLINPAGARATGLTIPPSLLQRAQIIGPP